MFNPIFLEKIIIGIGSICLALVLFLLLPKRRSKEVEENLVANRFSIKIYEYVLKYKALYDALKIIYFPLAFTLSIGSFDFVWLRRFSFWFNFICLLFAMVMNLAKLWEAKRDFYLQRPRTNTWERTVEIIQSAKWIYYAAAVVAVLVVMWILVDPRKIDDIYLIEDISNLFK